jgi:flavin reductase (DIM6/NTAB) family NADH-FMN oxidoreductase RutF
MPWFCPQPIFLIGTYNEDGSPNFAPISWVSATWPVEMTLVISMHSKKATKNNIFRTGVFSANLSNSGMIGLIDYFGSVSGLDGAKNAMAFEYENGLALDVPTLKASKWVYECRVTKTLELGESHTFFADVCRAEIDETLAGMDLNMVDLVKLDPVLWAACNYFTVGRRLGAMGDFLPAAAKSE